MKLKNTPGLCERRLLNESSWKLVVVVSSLWPTDLLAQLSVGEEVEYDGYVWRKRITK